MTKPHPRRRVKWLSVPRPRPDQGLHTMVNKGQGHDCHVRNNIPGILSPYFGRCIIAQTLELKLFHCLV